MSNSVHAYLQSKLSTLAVLRALGLRENRLARLYLAQILILAGGASLLGAVLGAVWLWPGPPWSLDVCP
ncbi:MAG: FtsX-like permease family protein [Gammaproteobacteria bacterium]